MNPARRMVAIYTLLAASLLLNVACFGYLAQSGGLRRIFVRMDMMEMPKSRADFQKEMEARFRKLPNTPAEIAFVGDSLIANGPWAEFYGEIHNRGIGGDTTSGVLGRIDEVVESRPREIVLMVGANDLANRVPPGQYIRHYRALLERIRDQSPETATVVIGILPINPTMSARPTQTNPEIDEANKQLEKLVGEFLGVKYVNLGPGLADPDGNLRPDYSADGIHLNIDGYLAIRAALAEYIVGSGPKRVTSTRAEL